MTNNSGSGQLPENAVPELESNHIAGPLACIGNTHTLNQGGNTTTGPHTGQCR